MKKNIWKVKLGFVLTILFVTGGVQIPEDEETNKSENSIIFTENSKNKQEK